MDLALGLVDYVTCMFEGRVLVEEAPDDIRRNKQVQEVYLGTAAPCLRFAICTAAMARRTWCAASRSTSAPARSWRCSAATAWARPRLIRSIMGLTPPQIRAGSITWRGESLVGLRPHDIAERKIAIVPQGRRLFPSLTVTEHLTMLKSARAKTAGRWSACSDSFRALPSGAIIAAANSPAASAACSRSAAR